MAEQDKSQQTEAPSSRRLRRAREQGQAPLSKEAVAFGALGAASMGMVMLLPAALLPQLNGKLGAQLPPLVVSASSWVSGIGIMLAIGLVVGLPPALRAMHVRIVDALAAG